MIQEIQAKTILTTVQGDDSLFGLKYNFNLYRGCQHQCIYCDSRSLCYGIEDFNSVLVKINAIELLQRELGSKRVKGPIGTGSMSDPYTPVERQYNLTGRALALIARFRFPVRIITKSDLVLKDIETLVQINQAQAVVCFTLTTTDDDLARKLEPGAPSPSARLEAMATLAARGIVVGTTMMPVLPFLEDNAENVTRIITETARRGGSFILPWFGMSLRDRQRAIYYEHLDRLFPGLRQRYERRFGERYGCAAEGSAGLARLCKQTCLDCGLAEQIPPYQSMACERQLPLGLG